MTNMSYFLCFWFTYFFLSSTDAALSTVGRVRCILCWQTSWIRFLHASYTVAHWCWLTSCFLCADISAKCIKWISHAQIYPSNINLTEKCSHFPASSQLSALYGSCSRSSFLYSTMEPNSSFLASSLNCTHYATTRQPRFLFWLDYAASSV